MNNLLNQIHHIDALELLRAIPDNSVDMVLCDLPYGVTGLSWDTIIPFDAMWEQLKRIRKNYSALVFTATEPFATKLRMSNFNEYKYDWIWLNESCPTGHVHAKNKPMRVYENVLVFSDGVTNHESLTDKRMAYYPQMIKGDLRQVLKKMRNQTSVIGKRPSHHEYFSSSDERYPVNVLRFNQGTTNSVHPTQKPVALFEYLIKTYTREGEIVLDMTCGSGTTAIACMRSNRQFICGDLSEEYVQIARTRLQNCDPYQPSILPDGSKQLSLFTE